MAAAVAIGVTHASARTHHTEITPLDGEKWWGGMVALGTRMPMSENTPAFDLAKENRNNQNVPLLVSSAGRYVWSDKPFAARYADGRIHLYSQEGELTPVEAGSTLRDAYLAASDRHFRPSGQLPDTMFFSMPQYNTWIELLYNQNQHDILDYAAKVKEHGFPTGVFMVDDNWQKYYGNFEFKPERFPDPKGMADRLHRDGFRIMLWISPFVSPDSPEFRELSKKGYLIRRKGSDEPAIMQWWNGYSACYDMSNPEAAAHFRSQLKAMQADYGIDGFKFDAGDIAHYTDSTLRFHDSTATAADMCAYWAKAGLDFPFNEYRACWKMGGQPLVQRLGDKDYSWRAVELLIPDMIQAGLLGYAYTCPDMIGGGQYGSFIGKDMTRLDQELIVRSCQIHALMPMMQFSVAPWRILDRQHLEICRRFARKHQEMGSYIMEQARHAASSGEPIVRHMEYSFPHQGFADCTDQFMLGDRYMIAPMTKKASSRSVRLPKGLWRDDRGKKFKGPRTIETDVPLDRLPIYERLR